LPPPVAFFVILGAGVLAAHLRPFPLLPEGLGYRLAFGLPFFATALSIGVWSFSAFRRYSTSPQFGKAVSRLIQHGPYRFSRNPLYIALLLVLLGFAFTLNNAWLASGVLIFWFLLDRLVVTREEQFLSLLFGAEYVSYTHEVRRWL
jgi:protein-S-isoprenylcysteine O-methyltransferase Ste14